MAIALATPIADSERFIELVEPVLPPPPPLNRAGSSQTSGKTTPPRPRRSSARGLQIFTPATLSEALHVHEARSFTRPTESYTDDEDAAGGVERFYSPLSSPAILTSEKGTDSQGKKSATKERNRTSEIPVLPNNGHKESGVTRAFRSKTGTNGSISLSILPSAAALSEMLQQQKSADSHTADIVSTYQPSSAFARSSVSLGSPTDVRRPSGASTIGSLNTKPLTIKRKKPAVYNPEEATLPISRAASIDACTPTSEDGDLTNIHQGSSPRRKTDLSLPVTQTFQTPLKRIPHSDITPPSTPPTWTGSTHSDTYTEEDSLPVSPRSSANRHVGEKAPSSVKGRKLQYGQEDSVSNHNDPRSTEGDDRETVTSPEIPRRGTNDHVDLDFLMPFVCDLEEMKDRPGMLRRESDDESTDMEEDDDDEEDEDGDDEYDDQSVQDFGLEDFPVPSVILTSAKNTPRMYPLSPNLDNLTSTPAERKASIGSAMSRLRPKTDLYPIPTDANGNQEWDQATELEIRDRVFRAEIKKPNKSDKIRRKNLQRKFDQFKKPTKLELYEASLLSVRDENGHKIRFGQLFEEKQTIVCFIRHFWCSQCQNYVDAIAKLKPEILAKYNMNLVIISNGSWKMIKPYRKLLGNKCPYPIYTDRPKNVYTALGMTLRTWDAGKEKDRGQYIQNSLGASVIQGIKSGIKLPIKPPGDQQQLGGEFILGPGINNEIKFCHRMKTTRGHAEIEEILASVDINFEEENKLLNMIPRSENSTPSIAMLISSGYQHQHQRQYSSKRKSGIINGSGAGISNLPNSPSLAASIMNRLHYGSPKVSSSNGSGAISPTPGSPTLSTSGGITGSGGISDTTAVNNGGSKPRTRRLQKKNRNSQSDLTSPVISQSPVLGISSDLSKEIRERAERTTRRPLSNSTLSQESGIKAAAAAPSHSHPEETENTNASMNAEGELGSASPSGPPHLPTPTSITPLSMGFLSVPSTTPPLYNAANGIINNNANGNITTQEIRRSSISQPVSQVIPTPRQQVQIPQQYRKSTTISEIYDNYLEVPNKNGSIVHDEGQESIKQEGEEEENGLLPQSSSLYHSSSRFSESSNEEAESGKLKVSRNKRDSKRKSDNKNDNSASSSPISINNGNGPRLFVKGLSLRGSNSSLKSSKSK